MGPIYRISSKKRKYSPTPIVRMYISAHGNPEEVIVLCASNMKKEEGDKFLEHIVELLDKNS